METKLQKKCKKIKIVLTDVDGVLTDGGMYYSDKGEIMKKFHVRDGMAVTLLNKNNIPTIIVTKEKTKIVRQWANKMNINKVHDGIVRKELVIDDICKNYNVTQNEIAFIGDDVNDLELMSIVGFSATPKDGIKQAKKIADYVCESNGGQGAFNEFAHLILEIQFPTKKKLY